MEERTLLALMIFSSLVVLRETIAEKVFALFLSLFLSLTICCLLILWSGGIAVTR